jgi:CubicO group peptidase (beta-lactamase class C family)
MDQMYVFLSGYRLTRAPGSSFEYSNYGFGLLGNLLVRRAGQADYEALLLERITRPLGMDSTRIELTPEMRSRLATPHLSYSVVTSNWDIPTLAGCGAIRSTANDMLTFLAANMRMTDTELQPALQLANTPQRPTDGGEYIGLGWIFPKSGNGIHWHNGETGGYHSYLGWDPQRKIGAVVLANAAVDIDDVGLQLIRRLPLTSVSIDPQVLAAYAGKYQFPDGVIMTIRVDGTRIFIQAPNRPEYELYALSENQFYPREFDAVCTFYRNDKGEVDRMVLLESGETYEAKKVP